MMQSKLLSVIIIFAVFRCFNEVEGKYCAYEENGKTGYYICPRNEFCCSLGCCVSPVFHFYQLWYYWLLVLFMFLLCSGGGWWYRYWLQARYRDAVTTVPEPSSHRTRNLLRSRVPHIARVSYNPTGERVVLHRIWKGPPSASMNPEADGSPPLYSPSRTQSNEMALSQAFDPSHPECPYYYIYGPPPSYESVIREQSLPSNQDPLHMQATQLYLPPLQQSPRTVQIDQPISIRSEMMTEAPRSSEHAQRSETAVSIEENRDADTRSPQASASQEQTEETSVKRL